MSGHFRSTHIVIHVLLVLMTGQLSKCTQQADLKKEELPTVFQTRRVSFRQQLPFERRAETTRGTTVTSTITTSTSQPQYIGDNGQGTPVVVDNSARAITFRLVDEQLYAGERFWGAVDLDIAVPNKGEYQFEGKQSPAGGIVTRTFSVDSTRLFYRNAALSNVDAASAATGAQFCVQAERVYLKGFGSDACSVVPVVVRQSFVPGPETSIITLDVTESAYTRTVIGTGSTPDSIVIRSPARPTTESTTTIIDGLPSLTTLTKTQSLDNPGQIIVQVPASTVTTTILLQPTDSSYTSLVPQTYTQAASILLGVPVAASTVTVTTIDTFSTLSTRTVTQDIQSEGRIIIEIPATTITTTQLLQPTEGPFLSTLTQTDTNPGTVFSGVPASATTTTITTIDTFSRLSTRTIEQDLTSEGQIIVQIPATTTTTTIIINPNVQGSSQTITQSDTRAGTILVFSPASPTTTTSKIIYAVSSVLTFTVSQALTTPGTLFVYIPATTITKTTVIQPTDSLQRSTYSQTDTDPGTVLVLSPARSSTTSTTTIGAFSMFTTTTVSQNLDTPATLSVLIPATTSTISTTVSSYLQPYTLTQVQTYTAAGTVVVGRSTGYYLRVVAPDGNPITGYTAYSGFGYLLFAQGLTPPENIFYIDPDTGILSNYYAGVLAFCYTLTSSSSSFDSYNYVRNYDPTDPPPAEDFVPITCQRNAVTFELTCTGEPGRNTFVADTLDNSGEPVLSLYDPVTLSMTSSKVVVRVYLDPVSP